jgi:hypothetical protein
MFITQKLLRSPLGGNLPCLQDIQDITPITVAEGKSCILLDDKDGYFPPTKFLNSPINLLGNLGRKLQRKFVNK